MIFSNPVARLCLRLSILILTLISYTSSANSVPNLVLSNDIQTSSLSSLHWADNSRTATPATAAIHIMSGELVTGHFTLPLADASHWFAFTLTNPTDQALTPNLHVRQSYPSQVNLHYQQHGQWMSQLNGTDIALKQRQVQTLTPAFNLTLGPQESRTFLLEVHSKIKLFRIDIKIDESKNSSYLDRVHTTLVKMFIGAAFALCIINALMYLSFKDKVYLYYCAYSLSFVAATSVINSFDLFFDLGIADRSYLFLAYHCMIFFFSLFVGQVLETKNTMPWVDKLLIACRWLAIIIAILTLADGNYFSYTMIAFIPVSVLFLGILVYGYFTGKPSARLLAIGIICFLTGIISTQLVNAGVIASNVVTDHGALIGALTEMLIFSFALFRRVLTLNADKHLANATLLTMSEQTKIQLEKTVAERTQELSKATQVAEQANDARGRYLTTINHEIRTPLNGILGMIEVLQHYPLDAPVQQHISTLQAAGQQLTSLVNNVLDYSKIDHELLDIRHANFDLHKLIHVIE